MDNKRETVSERKKKNREREGEREKWIIKERQ